jgi:hypothetical protein
MEGSIHRKPPTTLESAEIWRNKSVLQAGRESSNPRMKMAPDSNITDEFLEIL